MEYLFPTSYATTPFAGLCDEAFDAMAAVMPNGNLPRVPGWVGPDGYARLLNRYGQLPADPTCDVPALVSEMSRDLLAGTTVWRCPALQYNVGAAVNVVAAVMYALGLDLNVYLISDGQAGNAVVAERAVSAILADLSGVDREAARGLFTFGGTGTLAYAIKCGIRKCSPESVRCGVPDDIHVVVTEDAHFSHETAADWLGIGSDRLITVPASPTDRRSDLAQAELLMRQCIERGGRIGALLINGGTTYDHTVDDVRGFAALRDRLVADYRLSYRPHLHVDSVIGWSWLFFAGFEFADGGLGVPAQVVDLLRRQYERVAAVRHADSWGLDFHKGVGGCPVDCSFVQFNSKADLALLRKGLGRSGALHQLADEFSDESPVDYTLETSRAGGKALAALAALHTLGRSGYRQVLADLIAATHRFRELISSRDDMDILNRHSLGFQTMVRLRPPEIDRPTAREELHRAEPATADLVRSGNAYLKGFFTWDNDRRMNTNGGGVVYSFSGRYVTTVSGADISGLKFYSTNPHTGPSQMAEAVELLARLKSEYDGSHPWPAS